jgi:hypothetical protein
MIISFLGSQCTITRCVVTGELVYDHYAGSIHLSLAARSQSGQTRLPWLKLPGLIAPEPAALPPVVPDLADAGFDLAPDLPPVDLAAVLLAVLRVLVLRLTAPDLLLRIEATSCSPVLSLLVMKTSPIHLPVD